MVSAGKPVFMFPLVLWKLTVLAISDPLTVSWLRQGELAGAVPFTYLPLLGNEPNIAVVEFCSV